MASSIDSDTTSRLLNLIQRNRSGVRTTLAQVASGNRIVNAGIDPAGLALSDRLNAEIRALSQASRNIETGSNFINVAEGGLATINDLAQRGRELAVQASNGTLGDTERGLLNTEFQQVLSEIDRISQSLEFNGQNLLNGELAPGSSDQVNIQVGSGSGPEDQINLNVVEATDTTTLGLAGTDISTVSGALTAIDSIDTALTTVNQTRANVGAVSNRLAVTAATTRDTIVNLSAAEEAIAGTDIARAISQLTEELTRLEASIRSLGIQNRSNENRVGRLLNINT
ncbi:flagellin N-terminal helical domain-containing protein [Nitrospina watsonii]|uniref:Flagellin n=1 Tax=Nitrospina watsonii TaxID=1323948 RepID=A0ABN8VU85_9BACT|nr:flagellin [Nitrospina watsonii]CAI2717410.1 Flagellin [Nitrospina watsonii]